MDHPSRPALPFLALTTAAVAAATLAPASAVAQGAWPERPIRMIIAFAPGGGTDVVARLLAPRMSEDLGQPIVLENRAGAGGTIGSEVAIRSAPDGYTFGVIPSSPIVMNPALYKQQMRFDPAKDLIPVANIASVSCVLGVQPEMPVRTVAELVAYAKANPGKLNFATPGVGTPQHIAGELFKMMAKVDLQQIPYKGGGPAIADLAGGHIKFFFSNTASSTPHVKAGTIRAIAHTGTERLATFPDLPAVAETLPGFEAFEWNGVFLPAGTPKEIVDRLSAALNAALKDEGVRAKLAALSVQSKPNTPEDFARFVQDQTAKWGRIIREGNIKVE